MVPDLTEHARFFDHLVELVPAKFYYDDETRTDARFLAKAAKEALRADIKLKAKLAKLDKLNPDKALTTLEVQRRKSQEAHAGNGIDHADDHGPSTSGRPIDVAAGRDTNVQAAASGLQLKLQGNQPSREELRQRLQKKLEEARQRRKASAEAAKEWKTQALQGNASSKEQQQQNGKQGQQQHAGTKRKGESAAEQQHGGIAGKQPGAKSPHGNGQAPPSSKKARREDQSGSASGGEATEDFKFARIEVEDGGRHGPKGARRPPKQVLLKQAEAQKAEREALAGTEEGKAKAHQAAWKAALARAAGEKVLDDPKLLRRSLKRESKLKEKHSKAWQERVAVQQDAQAARQTKRKENLAARRQTKVDNKKAKREKKLLRPGFEGRKEGFITPGGGAAAGAK